MAVGKPDKPGVKTTKRQLHEATAFRVVAAQLITTVAIAGMLWLLCEPRDAVSALAGGLAGALPNLYLAGRISRLRAGMPPARILRAIYVGEALKLMSTLALFVIAFKLLDVNVLIMFGAYLATVIVNWFALLVPDPAFEPGPVQDGLA